MGDHNETSIDSRTDKSIGPKKKNRRQSTLMYTMMTLIKLCDKWRCSAKLELQDMPGYSSANLILNSGRHVLKSPYIIYAQHTHYIIFIASHLNIYHSSHSSTRALPPIGQGEWLNLILTSSNSIFDCSWVRMKIPSTNSSNIQTERILYHQINCTNNRMYITIPANTYNAIK